MKQKANPIVIAVAVVVLIGVIVVLFRNAFPPDPPPDTANAGGMPDYAKKFLAQKRSGLQPAGTFQGGSAPTAGKTSGGTTPGN